MKYDNVSIDGKVGFIEEGHKYEVVDGEPIQFTSVTTLIKDHYEEFDEDKWSKKKSESSDPKYAGKSPDEIKKMWRDNATQKSGEGTILHEYGQHLLDYRSLKEGGKLPKAPELVKARHVPVIVDDLLLRYELAKTELLVYSEKLKIAGQSDIILKKVKDGKTMWYAIYDWKFLSKPIEKTSYYNKYARRYKMMTGIFKHLMDCNWIHYSIQLAIYQTLTGDPQRIREKVLVCVYDDGWEYVPTYPMRVFWDSNNNMQAVYETRKGVYDSRTNKLGRKWPDDIKGR